MKTKNDLCINKLSVSILKKKILDEVSLEVAAGQLHVLMGPNGSGKTTLAQFLAGQPDLVANKKSRVTLSGSNLLNQTPDQRFKNGLMLTFQYPVEVPGVRVLQFLWRSYQQRFSAKERQIKSILDLKNYLEKIAPKYGLEPELYKRSVNVGLSGGEKKKFELLQVALLKPKIVIFDETDSGLDVDSLKMVAKGINQLRQDFSPGILLITHYERVVNLLNPKPNVVSIMKKGRIIASGGAEVITQVEKNGYQSFR